MGAVKVGRFWRIPLFDGMPKIIAGRRGPKGKWKKRPQKKVTYIHVRRQILARNKKYGTIDPGVLVRRGNLVTYCHEIDIVGPSRIVYQPNRPLNCGATVWIEVEPTVKLIAKTFN
jgi:hypothetical protein